MEEQPQAADLQPTPVEPMSAGDRSSLWFVDPELRAAARDIAHRMHSFPGYSLNILPVVREAMSAMAMPPLDEVPYERRSIPGVNGHPAVTIYVVNAKPGTARAGILHCHGGGFIVGAAADYLRLVQEVARALDCVIVTVDYRLAPETRWEGSLSDNYAGLLWLHQRAEQLGADRSRLAVMGESAGGGHAALLAIAARDRGEVPLAFQCLTYPMLDDRTGSARRVREPIGTIGWTMAANAFGWTCLLGEEAGSPRVPRAAVPARTADLQGLPPAWIGVGSLDLFVGENLDYARRLLHADVPTELLVLPRAFHGFDLVAPEAALARAFAAARIGALRRALL